MFNFLKNKKTKNKKSLQSEYENIQVQLVNLLNENRAIHQCLSKLHTDIQNQLMELKDISLNQTYNSIDRSSMATPTFHRKNHSTLKKNYV